jgi:hypothetical protein
MKLNPNKENRPPPDQSIAYDIMLFHADGHCEIMNAEELLPFMELYGIVIRRLRTQITRQQAMSHFLVIWKQIIGSSERSMDKNKKHSN